MITINNVLDIYKRQVISTVLDNTGFKYYILKQYIQSYITPGGSFSPLLDLYRPNIVKLSSISLNAFINLAFLDFYSLYTILFSNVGEIQNLELSSKGKMEYSEYLFKDIYSSIKSADIRNNSSYGFYEDFVSDRKSVV